MQILTCRSRPIGRLVSSRVGLHSSSYLLPLELLSLKVPGMTIDYDHTLLCKPILLYVI
jgi:hypothetical protein